MGSKIGIIFAFLLSIAAATGAYYLYQNLVQEREVRLDLKKKYDVTKEKVLNLQSEKTQIKAAKEQYQSESEDYQRQIYATQNLLGAAQSKASKLEDEQTKLEEQLKEKEDRLAEMERKVVELQRQAEEAMRACQVTPSDVQSSLDSGSGMPLTKSSLTFSSPDTATAKTTDSSATQAATATPTGPAVLTVNRKFNFVVVNMGLNDGLKMGDKLKVVKDGRDSATLQVEKLYDKFSAAAILDENPRNQVSEGDEVRKS